VILPKIYNGREQDLLLRQWRLDSVARADSVSPEAAEAAYRTGDFSALGKGIIDPAKRSNALPGNIIPQSYRFQCCGVAAETVSGGQFPRHLGNKWTTVSRQRQLTYQYTARLDHNFNEKHRVTRDGRPIITTTITLSALSPVSIFSTVRMSRW
jgi:hypothetical protein